MSCKYHAINAIFGNAPSGPICKLHSALTSALAAARQAQGLALGRANAIGLHELAGIRDDIWIGEVIAAAVKGLSAYKYGVNAQTSKPTATRELAALIQFNSMF